MGHNGPYGCHMARDLRLSKTQETQMGRIEFCWILYEFVLFTIWLVLILWVITEVFGQHWLQWFLFSLPHPSPTNPLAEVAASNFRRTQQSAQFFLMGYSGLTAWSGQLWWHCYHSSSMPSNSPSVWELRIFSGGICESQCPKSGARVGSQKRGAFLRCWYSYKAQVFLKIPKCGRCGTFSYSVYVLSVLVAWHFGSLHPWKIRNTLIDSCFWAIRCPQLD